MGEGVFGVLGEFVGRGGWRKQVDFFYRIDLYIEASISNQEKRDEKFLFPLPLSTNFPPLIIKII